MKQTAGRRWERPSGRRGACRRGSPWIRDLEAKGHLKEPGQPLNPDGKVVRGKKRMVTDGPYIEAKELVLGFIIVQARDLEQAVELSTGCPMLEGGGSVEVRPIELTCPLPSHVGNVLTFRSLNSS